MPLSLKLFLSAAMFPSSFPSFFSRLEIDHLVKSFLKLFFLRGGIIDMKLRTKK